MTPTTPKYISRAQIFSDLSGYVSIEQTPAGYALTLHSMCKQTPIGHVSVAPDGRYVDSRGLCGGIGWDSLRAAINGLIYADHAERVALYCRKSPPERGDRP